MFTVAEILAQRKAEAGDPPTPASDGKTALQRILELTGKSLDQLQAEIATSQEALPQPERVAEVPDTAELRRIVALPRRSLDSGEEWAKRMTDAFRRTSEPCAAHAGKCPMALRPIQALALHDIHQFGGLLGPIRVGGGKTLISYLAPYILDAKRPLLCLPAKLVNKTRREFRHLAQHWHGPAPDAYRIETYELLGRPQAAELLERYQPDLIVFDECHKVKNPRAAVTRRVRRYMDAHPGTKVVAMSGTITKRSLRDYFHIAHWCLPRICPVPVTHKDLEAWADALDERVNQFRRVRTGALKLLCNAEELEQITYGGDTELSAVRRAYGRRLVETPGVVASQDGALGVALSISGLDLESPDPIIEQHFTTLRTMWETPDGHPIADGITLRRHARELGLGLYYRWNPRPPEDWLEARKAWAKFCREVIKHNRRGIDSEAVVVSAVDQGLYPMGKPVLELWRALRDTFIPNTEAVWCSQESLNLAKHWAQHNPGIIWVEHVQFGIRLAELTGLSYYGAEGKDANGRQIEDHPPGQAMIASTASNFEGRNLQAWSRNLILSCPASGDRMEQLMGRTHRDGQSADEVTVDIYTGCLEYIVAFHQARKDAANIQDTFHQAQRLLYADVDFPSLEEIPEVFGWGYRWNKQQDDFG